MPLISLSQGKFAIVDESDMELLSQHKWYARKDKKGRFYAIRTSGKNIRMHRFLIANDDKDSIVDHKNGDGLDNRRNNLRLCTRHQNSLNRKKSDNATSPYKGVSRAWSSKKWTAELTINKKRIYLGKFENEVDAAKAYDEAAVTHHGEFANLNFK